MYSITIDETKCKVCGECVSICPNEIYKIEDNHLVVGSNASECSGCQSCVSVCGNVAITVLEV